MKDDKEIVLRYLSDTDKSNLAALANNKNISNNLRDIFPHPYTESDAQFFINLTQKESPQMNFAIEFRAELCGVAGLKPGTDVHRMTAEIGYWIGEPFWGNGIATRTVKLITRYGLEELGLTRIHCGIYEFNAASMRVVEKNGYQKDGIFKKAVFKNGKTWDEHRYSITK
jgi:[ribosomal protein S5]-alanine N-acetyltransferase